jgi:hypothetical protein
MMIQPSLLVLLGATIIGQVFAATSYQRKSDVPDLIWSNSKSANEESACKEQYMSTLVEKKREKTKL